MREKGNQLKRKKGKEVPASGDKNFWPSEFNRHFSERDTPNGSNDLSPEPFELELI